MRQGDEDVLIVELYSVNFKTDPVLDSGAGVSFFCAEYSQPSCCGYPCMLQPCTIGTSEFV